MNDSVRDEAWSYQSVLDGEAFPADFVEMIWSWHKSSALRIFMPLETRQQLEVLITTAFQASLRSEENRQVRLQVLFHLDPKQVTIRFEIPLAYSAEHLIKLAPTIGIGGRWIVVAPSAPSSSALEIIGICDPDVSPLIQEGKVNRWGRGLTFDSRQVDGLTLSVLGPGALQVGSVYNFELRDCSIRTPFPINRIPAVSKWYEEAARTLEVEKTAAGMRSFIGLGLVRRTWSGILGKICHARHGGCLLVVPGELSRAATKSLRIKYPLGSQRLQDVIRSRMGVEPALSSHQPGKADISLTALDEAHFLEHDLARMADLIASLAAVDGSVLLRRDLELIGFGVEIIVPDVPSELEKVNYGIHPPPMDQPPSRSLVSFGMRHRSAYRFCQKVNGSIAFVASQDGDLRVFCNVDGSVTLFEGLTPEDWLF